MSHFPANRRSAVLISLLGLTGFAVFSDSPQRDLVSATVAAEPSESRMQPRQLSAAELLAKLKRPQFSPEMSGELFGSKSWQPAAPVTQAALAVPTVPPFPYRYLGRLVQDDGQETVFLTRGEDTFLAVVGGTLEGAYRVERVGEDQFELTYLPMNAPVTIRFAQIPQPAEQQAAFGAPGFAVAPVANAATVAPNGATPVPASKPADQQASQSKASVQDASTPTTLGAPPSLGSNPMPSGPIAGIPMQLLPVPSGTMQISPPPTGLPLPGFENSKY